MAKKQTKKKPEKKDERTLTGHSFVRHGAWKFMLAVLIVTAVLIVFGIFITKFKQEQKTLLYNGFLFEEKATGNKSIWVTRVDVNGKIYDIPFYYLPTEVEDVLFEPGLADAISQAAIRPEIVYIALAPDAGSKPVVGAVEISRLLGDRYGLLNLNVVATLTEAPSEDFNSTAPFVTCANASDGVLIIEYEQSDTNGVWHEGNCVRVQYEVPEDSIRVSDRFAYELLSIM